MLVNRRFAVNGRRRVGWPTDARVYCFSASGAGIAGALGVCCIPGTCIPSILGRELTPSFLIWPEFLIR